MKIRHTAILFLMLALGYASIVSKSTTAQDQLVEDVELRGYRSVSREEIIARIKTRPSEKFDLTEVHRDLERILEMGIFDKLNCKVVIEDGPRGGVVVIFLLKEIAKAGK